VRIGCLEVEADEMGSFVKQKANKQGIWIAMDKQTRQIIAFHVGDRSHESAKQLWANLPAVYREQAMFSTEQYVVSPEWHSVKLQRAAVSTGYATHDVVSS
jgi:IS1 family transposase